MTRKDQIGRESWTEAALAAVAEEGIQGVSIEPLARALKVTKGSFYWHFSNRDALLTAAVERWEEKETKVLAQAAAVILNPRERLVILIERAHNEKGLRLTRAFTVAAGNALLGPSVRRVTKLRLVFLAECFAALGAPEDDCKHAARTVYAAYLGLAELNVLGLGAQSKSEMRAYVNRMVAALVPRSGVKGELDDGAGASSSVPSATLASRADSTAVRSARCACSAREKLRSKRRPASPRIG